MLLLSGCHKLTDRKCIGRQIPILLCKQILIQCLAIHSSVFFKLDTNIRQVLFPMIIVSNTRFLKFFLNTQSNTIVGFPAMDTHGSRHGINKSIQEE